MALWIKIETPICRSFKTVSLAGTLKIDECHVVGLLTCLWCNVLEMHDDGDISNWTDAHIEYYAGWKGEPGKFAQALRMEEHKYLDVNDGQVLIHDWLDTASNYLTIKYASKHKEILSAIWAKHGKVYGSGEPMPATDKPQRPPKKTKQFAEDSVEVRASKYLYKRILETDPLARQPDFQKWAIHIDGLIRLDKRDKDEIRKVIDWIQTHDGGDGFRWRDQILSTDNLRVKYPKLLRGMNNGNSKTGKGLYKKGNSFDGFDPDQFTGVDSQTE